MFDSQTAVTPHGQEVSAAEPGESDVAPAVNSREQFRHAQPSSPPFNINNTGFNLGNIANMSRLFLTRIYVIKKPTCMPRDPSPGDSRFFLSRL